MESSSAMELHPETGRRAAKISPRGNLHPRESVMCDLGECNHDVVDLIMSFGIPSYLSVASVSTRWRRRWGQRPRVTSPKWAIQSCSCLDWASACGLHIRHAPCLLAAAEGRLRVLQHAVALRYSREGMAICERAAAGGHLAVVKWGRANGYPWGLSKLLAAEGGHLEVLKWCIASTAPDVIQTSLVPRPLGRAMPLLHGNSESAVLNAAVRGGHLETAIWCRQQGYRWNDRTCYLAAKGGHLELLRWLRDNGCPWSKDTMEGAVDVGDLELLEWCTANTCPYSGQALSIATRHGHLEVVQWLRGVGCRWGVNMCFRIACGGHFEVLKWCIANGCPWEEVPYDEGRFKFHSTVPMMLWAAANGCPWMADRCAMDRLCWHAAGGGNLEVLKWCTTSHKISTSKALKAVARNGHVHVLEWLRANTGVLDGYTDTELCSSAAASGSLETVKWCRANGYPWCQKTCTAAATSGNLELLQWCRANGCPWGNDTCKEVILQGNFEMLAWCRDKDCPPDERWRQTSIRSGYAEMIEWRWESPPSKTSAKATRRSRSFF